MEADRPAIYRPRRPRASPLWQCVNRHLPELRASGRVRRAVEENVLERFLECGDLHCKCGAQMRVIALIEDPAVIERILSWPGLWEPPRASGPSPPAERPSPPLTYHPVPDIA